MTETIIPQKSELEALESHLAVYGADLSRWPLASQQRFVVLLTNNGEAQRLMAEAKALARIVFDGPIPALQPEHASAWRAKLLSAIAAERGSRAGANALPAWRPREVLPALVHGRCDANRAAHAAAQPMAAPQRVFGWPAGAAMAASLVLGLVAGALGLADQIIAPIRPMVAGQIDRSAETDEAGPDDELAFGLDVIGLDEEGTL